MAAYLPLTQQRGYVRMHDVHSEAAETDDYQFNQRAPVWQRYRILELPLPTPCQPSGEKFGAGLGELHIDTRFMPDQPSVADRPLTPGAVFVDVAVGSQERQVEQFDVDASVLDTRGRVNWNLAVA